MNVTIWPIWENGLDGTPYADKNDRQWPVNVAYEMYHKRLTDTELAAEYWLSSSRKERMLTFGGDRNSGTYKQAKLESSRMETIQRLALLPHASDNGYE